MTRSARGASPRPPGSQTPPLPRTVDLYGCAADGLDPRLWKRATPVVPASAFERVGRGIACGHYVIDYKGSAVVVHCANLGDRRVSVQFMFGGPDPRPITRGKVEAMLLGKVVVSEELRAAVPERGRLSDTFKDKGAQ